MTIKKIYEEIIDFVADVERSIEAGDDSGRPNTYRRGRISELDRIIFICQSLKVKIESDFDDDDDMPQTSY